MPTPDFPDYTGRRLAQAAIIRAFWDALGMTGLDKIGQHEVAVRQARSWFTPGLPDYETICGAADIDSRALAQCMQGRLARLDAGDVDVLVPFQEAKQCNLKNRGRAGA